MGSVEAFPSKGSSGTIADAWRRAGPIAGSGTTRVREARIEDYAAIRALRSRAAPYMAPCSLRQFESRRLAFPAGQLVAVSDGQVTGAASSFIVPWDDYGVSHTWKEITANGYFTTHDAKAETLYGCDLIVDAMLGGNCAARALFQARRRLARRMNLRRIISTARLAGYRDCRETMTPELHAMRVMCGDLPDASMRLHISQGFQYCGILHGYMPEDEASRGHAALLAWLNPLHSPPRPPAYVECEYGRKCA